MKCTVLFGKIPPKNENEWNNNGRGSGALTVRSLAAQPSAGSIAADELVPIDMETAGAARYAHGTSRGAEVPLGSPGPPGLNT